MDAYQKSIKTIIADSGKDYVILKDSIFHKEGGGQPADRGRIGSQEILRYDGEKFYLKNNPFKKGEEATLSIDWDYRYDLMKAHTAEHLLFCSMKKIKPELEIEKISLSCNESSIFIKGTMTTEELIKSQRLANEKIREGLEITEELVKKEEVKDARIKLEKIREENARIISIGGYDKAACSGTHVASTKEIGFLIISGAKKESLNITKVSFITGEKALDYSIKSAALLNELTVLLNDSAEKLKQRIISVTEENAELKSGIRKLSDQVINLTALKPENGIIFQDFPEIETERLIKKASIESETNDVIFVNSNTVIVAGKNSDKIFEALKSELGITGGGREVKIGRIKNIDLNAVKKALNQAKVIIKN